MVLATETGKLALACHPKKKLGFGFWAVDLGFVKEGWE
jgi:hypothetical protein